MYSEYYTSNLDIMIGEGASGYFGWSTYIESATIASGGRLNMNERATASGIYISSGASLYVGSRCSAFAVRSDAGAIVTTGEYAYVEYVNE